VRVETGFIDLIEEGEQPIVVPLADGIELVVVAAGALEVSPRTAVPKVLTRSAAYSTRNSSSTLPPSFVWRWRRLKAVARTMSRVGEGSRSPANCQRRNRSIGRFPLKARITQSRQADMSRSTSDW